MELYPDIRDTKIISTLRKLGFPILGDNESDLSNSINNPIRRLALHIHEVRVSHPITKEILTLRADIPASFRRMIDDEPDSNILKINPLSSDEKENSDTDQMYTPNKQSIVVSISDYLNSNNPPTNKNLQNFRSLAFSSSLNRKKKK